MKVRLDEAVALDVARRAAAINAYFDVHPGSGRLPPGLGLAIVDFFGWETASGRISDGAGSPWWRAVNGILVLDLEAAMFAGGGTGTSDCELSEAVAAWHRYPLASPTGQQRALWDAHELSISAGVAEARDLLDAETDSEREFTRLVLRVLSHATRTSTPTDTSELGDAVRRSYPQHYPVGQKEFDRLVTRSGSAPPHVISGR